jgi:hypothetical protein
MSVKQQVAFSRIWVLPARVGMKMDVIVFKKSENWLKFSIMQFCFAKNQMRNSKFLEKVVKDTFV